MSIIGIDFGSQLCKVATPRQRGIDVLANDYSKRLTPNVVAFGDKMRSMGESAKQKITMNIKNTFWGLRNLIGRQYDSPDVQEHLATLPFGHAKLSDGTVAVDCTNAGKMVSVTQLTSMMLIKLKELAETEIGSKVTDCCISVPCFYNDAQRLALLNAIQIAGLNCLRLFNETSAVALNFGIFQKLEEAQNVVFVNIGHQDLQCCAANVIKGSLTVTATSWDASLGGRAFDLILLDHFNEAIKEKFKIDPKSKARPRLRLEQECEKVRKMMTANGTPVPLNIEMLMDDKDVSCRIDREEFEGLAEPLFKRLVKAFEVLLERGGLKADQIDRVEIVGGSSRIPKVKQLVEEFFGKTPGVTMNSDEAVAKGCALQAAIASPVFSVKDFELKEKTPYGIKLSWSSVDADEGSDAEVFAENSNCATKMFSFWRTEPFDLKAVYSDPDTIPDKTEIIGTCRVDGVTPDAEGKSQKVKVKVKVNKNGVFSVESATLVEKLPEPEEPAAKDEEPAAEEKKEESKDVPMETEGEPSVKEGTEASAEPTSPPSEEDTKGKDGEQKEAGGQETKGDTEEKAEEDKKPEKKKQKTTKQTPLPLTQVKAQVLSSAEMNVLLETENEFKAKDREEIEKANAKNALEEYIYDMRDKCDYSLKDFLEEAVREAFKKTLAELEDWLYDEGEDQPKNVYNEKLKDLKSTGDPAEKREAEDGKRQGAIDDFQKSIVQTRKFLDAFKAGDEKYAHISAEDVEKVEKDVANREGWLNPKVTEQGKLAKHQDPVVLTSQLVQEKNYMEAVCNPIINKPKPEPKEEPPVEPPTEGETKTEGEPAKADGDEKPDTTTDSNSEAKPTEAAPESSMDLD